MTSKLRVGVVQHDPTVGDAGTNATQLRDGYDRAAAEGADLVVAPELSVLGYPPRDLLRREGVLAAQERALGDLARAVDGPPLVVGIADRADLDVDGGPALHNAAVVLEDGARTATYAKRLLPTYDVFDERRYFDPGTGPVTVSVDGVSVGLTVCEDAWNDVAVGGRRLYDTDPLGESVAAGADLLVTVAASPFSLEKPAARERRFGDHAGRLDTPVVFANQVGGNDELIFDGNSFAVGADGQVAGELPGFEPAVAVVDVPLGGSGDGEPGAPAGDEAATPSGSSPEERAAQAREALALGLADYFGKTGFDEAIVGMSGGIDSSVATALAVDALGADAVYGVTMPSTVTSSESVADARAVAENLGIEFDAVAIGDPVESVRTAVAEGADTDLAGLAYENLQARVRGDVLMSLANRRNALVLTPDNKSEAAVGYCTLYGDAVGALAPLGDCYKTLVYAMADRYNEAPPVGTDGPVIPPRVIEKPPTAELREDQTDEDELPAYDRLDPVLRAYVEGTTPVTDLRERFGDALVEEALGRLVRSEFKRRQTPPVLRVTPKAFGRGWAYPIAAAHPHLDRER